MDFDLAEQNYIRLEKLRRSGQIGAEEYRTQLGALRVVDEQGRTWMVQEQTGQWYVWDGAQWLLQAPAGRQGLIHLPAAAPLVSAPVMPMPTYTPSPQMPQTPSVASYPPQATYSPPQAPGVGSYAPPQAQGGYAQAGYAAQPVVPPQVLLARKRPGCISVTFSMLLWALVWGGAAWAVNAFMRPTPWWAYLGVGLAALATLILWVRLITRHGRALRKLTRGGAA